jgi:hypothetical protein
MGGEVAEAKTMDIEISGVLVLVKSVNNLAYSFEKSQVTIFSLKRKRFQLDSLPQDEDRAQQDMFLL